MLITYIKIIDSMLIENNIFIINFLGLKVLCLKSLKDHKIAIIAVAVILIVVLAGTTAAILGSSDDTEKDKEKVQIVAAENYWGDLIAQLGGEYVEVNCIITDPNADPHEYESTTSDAKDFAKADYIIINGVGYDSWAEQLISSGTEEGCKVLNIGDLVGVEEGENEHIWFSKTYVNEAVTQMKDDLVALDPDHAAQYGSQYLNLTASLLEYQQICANISANFSGTKIAGSAEIVEYIADSTGLDLVTSEDFLEAICEGYDPPAASIAEFQEQLQSGTVKVLVYSTQTETPITENLRVLAVEEGVPIVYVTHTMPLNMTFQEWMVSFYNDLEEALSP